MGKNQFKNKKNIKHKDIVLYNGKRDEVISLHGYPKISIIGLKKFGQVSIDDVEKVDKKTKKPTMKVFTGTRKSVKYKRVTLYVVPYFDHYYGAHVYKNLLLISGDLVRVAKDQLRFQ